MSDADELEPADDFSSQVLAPRPIDHARRYFNNAVAIGEPGQPDMLESGSIQAQHALMAQTAALISIAEALDRIDRTNRVVAREARISAKALDLLSKEITKLRYMARK